MADSVPGLTRPSTMSARSFTRLSEFIHSQVGIKLPQGKKIMLEARLQKRLRALSMSSYDSYVDFLFTEQGLHSELRSLIDVVTTNTTEFFREPKHFEVLEQHILPEWTRHLGGQRELRLWSAGCSFGMEPYTLSMVMHEFATINPSFAFSILATDISTRALQHASKGVYEMDKIGNIPEIFRKKYLLRSKDPAKSLVRMGPELRNTIAFKRLNFMEEFSFNNPLDIIFCRNVIIYFDKPTQERLFQRFCRCLASGGHLFIGHSESLSGMNLPLTQVAPTVYRKV
ncbi:CheR family methyltransferase [Oleidesulfovibrio sp.]|uniref:CheR family methyltransferase n=1 Tax=Oleidesulfovibrio sp. TaxID=2909707 RepID=UPI003A880F93